MLNYQIKEYNNEYFEKINKAVNIFWFSYKPMQLGQKQAWYYVVNGGYVLQSYNTLVGYLDTNTNKFFEFGKYSRTTSKQITTFCNLMGCDRELV